MSPLRAKALTFVLTVGVLTGGVALTEVQETRDEPISPVLAEISDPPAPDVNASASATLDGEADNTTSALREEYRPYYSHSFITL